MTTDTMLLGLKSEWAILLAIFILSSAQIVKIILDALKTRKDKSNEIKRMETFERIDNYFTILVEQFTEEISERQLPVLMNELLGGCRDSISIFASTSIAKNNIIDHEHAIKVRIRQYICNRFHSTQVNLGLFKWRNVKLVDFTEEGWCNEVLETVTKIVINSPNDKREALRQLNSYLNQKFEQYIIDALGNAYDV